VLSLIVFNPWRLPSVSESSKSTAVNKPEVSTRIGNRQDSEIFVPRAGRLQLSCCRLMLHDLMLTQPINQVFVQDFPAPNLPVPDLNLLRKFPFQQVQEGPAVLI
jgi:hypothetical protein